MRVYYDSKGNMMQSNYVRFYEMMVKLNLLKENEEDKDVMPSNYLRFYEMLVKLDLLKEDRKENVELELNTNKPSNLRYIFINHNII